MRQYRRTFLKTGIAAMAGYQSLFAQTPDHIHASIALAALKVIKERDSAKPLMLYLAYPGPHTPWLPTPEFAGKSEVGMYGDFMMMIRSGPWKLIDGLGSGGFSKPSSFKPGPGDPTGQLYHLIDDPNRSNIPLRAWLRSVRSLFPGGMPG